MTNLGWTVRLGHRAEETDRADQRHLQLQREPGRHRHAAGHRHRVRADRLVRRSAGLHRRGRAGRRVFVQRDPRRHSSPRRRDGLTMPIDRFQHVNIRTTDVERARDFYVRALGLRVGDRPPFASAGYWLYLGDVPVVHLVQLAPDDAREPGSGQTGSRRVPRRGPRRDAADADCRRAFRSARPSCRATTPCRSSSTIRTASRSSSISRRSTATRKAPGHARSGTIRYDMGSRSTAPAPSQSRSTMPSGSSSNASSPARPFSRAIASSASSSSSCSKRSPGAGTS